MLVKSTRPTSRDDCSPAVRARVASQSKAFAPATDGSGAGRRGFAGGAGADPVHDASRPRAATAPTSAATRPRTGTTTSLSDPVVPIVGDRVRHHKQPQLTESGPWPANRRPLAAG